jgi:hypothetical protein
MLKQKAQLESLVGEKLGHFIVDHDCPTHYIKAMLKQFSDYIDHIEQQNAVQAAPAPEAAPVAAEAPAVVPEVVAE